MLQLLRRASAALAVAYVGVLGACADAPTTPQANAPRLNTIPLPPEKVTVCKVGPAGTYNFTYTRNEAVGTSLVTSPFQVAAGQCVDIFVGGATAETIKISEVNLPAGTAFDHVVVQATISGYTCADYPAKLCPVTFTTPTVAVTANYAEGAIVTYYNKSITPPPPPPGGGTQGCTPGYWKQKQHFGSWVGYKTTDKFNTVFGVNLFSPNTTLLTALGTGGGGAARLGRHATAALLDASNGGVDYGMTTAQVIALVQSAVASGNYDMASDKFESMNERGCPLGRNE